MGVILQAKRYPVVYNYKNELLCTLNEVIDANENLRFGSLGEMTFEYPIYQVDQYNNLQLDSDGNPIINPKCQFIINENRILFNDRWYIIKIDEDNRTSENKLTITCTCNEIGYELQELMVESLRIIPPLENPVNATTAIFNVLMAAQQVRDNTVVSASGVNVVLDVNAHPTDGYYVGYNMYILKGAGAGQTRKITAYNGATKTVALDTAFSPQVDSTSVYRIYRYNWQVGTIDPVYNTALRSHEFDFVNALDALQQVRDKYLNANDEVGYLTYSSSWSDTENKWINYVNLVSPTPYNSIEFRYKKNLQAITRRKETQELYTRIIPEGIDNLTVGTMATENRTDSSVTYPTHVLGYNYVDNFQYYLALGYTYKQCVDNFVKVYKFENLQYTDALSLYNDTKKLLNKVSMPKITYIMSLLDLSRLTGREYERFYLGDTIRVIDEDLNIDFYATLSTINRNWIDPQNAQVELTNFVDNMSDMIKKIVNRGDNYSDLSSLYGNTATYVIADRKTSKNWRQADYVVNENEDAGYVIRKVIESIDENKGGRIVLLDGTYNCSSSIELRNNISIEGQGTATRIIGNPLLPSLLGMGLAGTALVKRKNISIKSLYMSTFQDCININYCDNVSIQNVVLENVTNNFILIQNSSTIDVSNNVIGNSSEIQGFDGIDIKASSNVVVNNNTINSVTFRNINIESTSGETTVSNNYIVHNQPTGQNLGCLFVGVLTSLPPAGWENTTQLYNINIINNTINCNTVKPSISVWNERNIIINGNKIMGGENGIYMQNLLDCKIFNNTIISTSATFDGIRLSPFGTIYRGRSEIQGNTIYNTSGAHGIFFDALGISDMFVTNNDLKYSCTNPAVNGLFLNGNTVTTSAGNRL